ncbi:MAG: tRNA pseudouridine(13) synthase TruD [Wenzhouxiangellaceae bacterium]
MLRAQAEDFIVDEILSHQPDGQGEHLWVRIEKCHANTEWVARQLARWAGVSPRAVSYAGLKDRHALTRQTFSIHLPGKADPDPQSLDGQGEFRLLTLQRAARKLQRGAVTSNRFEITLSNYNGDPDGLEQRLEAIGRIGVPNYFGEQRFGHRNLAEADAWLGQGGKAPRSRHRRGLYFSVLRAYLFNQVLARRVQQDQWCAVIDGDIVMLDGTRSWFVAQVDEIDQLQQRCAEGDLHPSGPLPGEQASDLQGQAGALEAAVIEPYQHWVSALAEQRVKAQRRALRVIPQQLNLEYNDRGPCLSFILPAGCYATVVLREIVDYQVAGQAAGEWEENDE